MGNGTGTVQQPASASGYRERILDPLAAILRENTRRPNRREQVVRIPSLLVRRGDQEGRRALPDARQIDPLGFPDASIGVDQDVRHDRRAGREWTWGAERGDRGGQGRRSAGRPGRDRARGAAGPAT